MSTAAKQRRADTRGESAKTQAPIVGVAGTVAANEVLEGDGSNGIRGTGLEVVGNDLRSIAAQMGLGETNASADIWEFGADAATDVTVRPTRDGRGYAGDTTHRWADIILAAAASLGLRFYSSAPALQASIIHNLTDLLINSPVGKIILTPQSGSVVDIVAPTQVKLGSVASGSFAYVGGAVDIDTTETASNGTTETTLASKTIIGNSCNVDGQQLIVVSFGIIDTATANTKQWKLKLNSQVVFDSGARGLTATNFWILISIIIRTSSSTAKCFTMFIPFTQSTQVFNVSHFLGAYASVGSLAFGSDQTLEITATLNAAGAELKDEAWIVHWGREA